MGSAEKNKGLLAAAEEILNQQDKILAANAKDIEAAKAKGMAAGLVDRLLLTSARIDGIVEVD